MKRSCLCRCHQGPNGDAHNFDGVDACNVLEAAVACSGCRDWGHCPALLSMELANEYDRRRREELLTQLPTPPEPASGCWEQPNDGGMPPGGSVDDAN